MVNDILFLGQEFRLTFLIFKWIGLPSLIFFQALPLE